MEKVFWDNPYQSSLNTKISSIINNCILLEETIIFSFSGGQESDEATIDGFKVIDSEIKDNLIYYYIEDGHNLKTGDTVSVYISWERRYKLMRLHFAAELILELVTKKLALEKIGAHISENKARIDFIYSQNISHIFEDLLDEYNQIIKNDSTITTGYTDIATQRRFWEIDGFSKVDCGGTYVKSTAEVGYVTLKRINIGGGKERIEITLVN